MEKFIFHTPKIKNPINSNKDAMEKSSNLHHNMPNTERKSALKHLTDKNQTQDTNTDFCVQIHCEITNTQVESVSDLGEKYDGPKQPILNNYPFTKFSKQNII